MQEYTDTENPNIIAQTSLMPFDYHFNTVKLNDCKTIQNVIDKLIFQKFKDSVLLITLNGKIINSNEYQKILLKENDIIGLNVIPQGSGDGKNIFRVFWGTIMMVVGAITGNPVLATYGFMEATTGTVGLLGWLDNKLPSKPIQYSENESPTKFVEGGRNELNPYGTIPVNLGTNRMFPNLAATTFTETNGNKQYCRQLFSYGYGKVQISERKLGETLIDVFSEIEFDDRLNADLNQGTKLYTESIYQDSSSVKITKAVGQVVRTTQRNVNEAIIDITFNGLCWIVGAETGGGGKFHGAKFSWDVDFQVYYSPTGEENWVDLGIWHNSAATTTQLRVSKRIVFPEIGQYDIKIVRLTNDNEGSSEFLTDSYLTALKSVSYSSPVRFANISGSAMRIRGTDQINGQVDSYNCIVTTLVKRYNPNTNEWDDDQPSSNPADLFRYVLQSPAFAKHLDDSQIDLEKLAEWWVYCDSLNLTYNRVIDYDTSVDDVINDICAAGVATPTKVNNIYSVIIDNERPLVKGLVTPRNSWDYKGSIAYPELPHALRIEFRNAEKGYETDERIVYNDGYNETNATLYERLQFTSCTNADLAYWYGRRYFATGKLQPETHTFKMDFECMTFNRGDRISLVNDVILVGVGQGRIKELIVDDTENPTEVRGFTVDDMITIPVVNNLGVRIRDNSGHHEGSTYYLLKNQLGTTNEFEFDTPIAFNNAPVEGSLCAFVEDGKELDLLITGIKMDKNQSATITAIDYAPERFKPLDEIPEWESNVTLSEDFYIPNQPELDGTIQSDEKVMIRNSDGSLTSIMVIPLNNTNGNDVVPQVIYRPVNTTEWTTATTLKREPDEVQITGLQDGDSYDFEIRYQRQSGRQLISKPLKLNNVKFIGGSTRPGNVENFRLTVTNGVAVFEWTPVEDNDISHYSIRYTSVTGEGVTWESAQVLYDRVTANSITGILRKGTYLIKAYDLTGYESLQPTTIVSTDSGAFTNVVEELVQNPTWAGTKINTYVDDNFLKLQGSNTYGVYNFYPDTLDLGEVYECSLSSAISSSLTERNGMTSYLIRDVSDIRSLEDVRTLTTLDWNFKLEMNLSSDGTNWTGWQLFTSSQQSFRYAKFRMILECESEYYTPQITRASVTVDMPDRYENEEDVEITNASDGKTIAYSNAFWNNPSVNVTIQDGAVDDRIEFVSKDNQGFTIKIFNATLNAYVTRTFDYLAAGYGKVVQ